MPTTKFAQLLDGLNNLYVPTEDLEEKIGGVSIDIVMFSAIALTVLVILAALLKDKYPRLKLPLFSLIASIMAASTLYMAASTVYLNVKSDSGGPVHWHADFETWVCDSQIELRDPTGFLSNKIGTSVLHEHDDQRIHLEGVVVDDKVDASLGKFFHVVGGAVTAEALVAPLNAPDKGLYFEDEIDGDGENPSNLQAIEKFVVQDEEGPYVRLEDGQTCNDGREGDVQVFAITLNEDGDSYTQRKLENPRDYVITDDPNVPPGDCIIFEFGPTRDRTDKLCEQYGIRDQVRCEEFLSDEKLCTLTEVDEKGNSIDANNAVDVEDTTDDDTQTSQLRDDAVAPSAEELAAEEELIALCKQFFNDDGTPTGIEIAAIKADGSQLDVDTECEDYRQELLGNPAAETNTEEEN